MKHNHIFKCMFIADVVGLLTSLHYDYIVDARDNLATVARLELTDERCDVFCWLVLFRIFEVIC
jgi:tRNA A37 threonylcarbamoyladenosine dehydratase